MLLNTPRRTDDDVRAVLQRADLRAERHAATEGQHLDVVFRARQTADFLGDLIRQFAGRAHDQCLATEEPRVDRVEQADTEGSGLAAAGLGLRDQVHALEDHRQALRLNRCHFGITKRLQVSQHGSGQRQRIESGVSHDGGPAKQKCRVVYHPPARPHTDDKGEIGRGASRTAFRENTSRSSRSSVGMPFVTLCVTHLRRASYSG